MKVYVLAIDSYEFASDPVLGVFETLAKAQAKLKDLIEEDYSDDDSTVDWDGDSKVSAEDADGNNATYTVTEHEVK